MSDKNTLNAAKLINDLAKLTECNSIELIDELIGTAWSEEEAGKVQDICEELNNIDCSEYTIVDDGDSHRYIIPLSKVNEWDDMIENGDPDDFIDPDWAESLEGETLVFTSYRKF